MIPPGVHFIYASVKEAPRIGFFHNFQPGEILIRKWDKKDETFSDYKANDEEVSEVLNVLILCMNLFDKVGTRTFHLKERFVLIYVLS